MLYAKLASALLISAFLVACAPSAHAQEAAIQLSVTSAAAAPGEEGRVVIWVDANTYPEKPVRLEFTVTYPAADIKDLTIIPARDSIFAGKSVTCTSAPGASRCVIDGNGNIFYDNHATVAVVILYPAAGTTATAANISLAGARAYSISNASLPVATSPGTLRIAQPSNSHRLSLSPAGRPLAPGENVTLNVTLERKAALESRVFGWTFSYIPDDVIFRSVTTGPAAQAAGNDASCGNTIGNIICLVWGLSTNNISSGVIAMATFTVAPTASRSVEIQLQKAGAGSPNSPVLSYGTTLTVLQKNATADSPVSTSLPPKLPQNINSQPEDERLTFMVSVVILLALAMVGGMLYRTHRQKSRSQIKCF